MLGDTAWGQGWVTTPGSPWRSCGCATQGHGVQVNSPAGLVVGLDDIGDLSNLNNAVIQRNT